MAKLWPIHGKFKVDNKTQHVQIPMLLYANPAQCIEGNLQQ